MKQFEAEIGPVLAEQRLIGFEADVAPGIEIEVRQAVGQSGNRAVERRGGKVARPLDDVWEAERRRRSSRSLRGVGLGGRRRNNASARSGHEAAEQRPAGQIVHERHSGWAVRLGGLRRSDHETGRRAPSAVTATARMGRCRDWCAQSPRLPC